MSNNFFDEKDLAPEQEDNFFDAADVVEDQPQEEVEAKAPDVGKAEAALRGAEQGLTFGFADELGGAIGAGIEAVAEEPMEQESKMEQLKRLYDEYREFNRARYEQAEEAQPGAFMAGDVAGSVIMPIPGAGVRAGAKAARLGGKAAAKQLIKQGAKAGAATGALEAAGRTEEELISEEGLQDVAVGAGAGGGLGYVLGKLGVKVDDLVTAKNLGREANIEALKGIGAKKRDFELELGTKTNKMATEDTAKGTGSALLESGVLKGRQSPGELKQDIVSKLNEVGSSIKSNVDSLDSKSTDIVVEDLSELSNKTLTSLDEDIMNLSKSDVFDRTEGKALFRDMASANDRIKEAVESALDSPNKFTELVELKRNLQNNINFDNPDASSYNEFLIGAQRRVNDLIYDLGKDIDPQVAQKLVDDNSLYQKLTMANKISGSELAGDMAKDEGLGFRELLASGVISAATKTPLAGPIAIGGKKIAEKVAGKDSSKIINTMSAFHKAKRAKQLMEDAGKSRVEKVGEAFRGVGQDGITKSPLDLLGAGGVAAKESLGAVKDIAAENVIKSTAVASAVVDENKLQDPYSRGRVVGEYVEKATPESIVAASDQIRREYGKDGEKLAMTLDKVAEKDLHGRRALMFQIMQDPNNRRMLGLSNDEE